MKRFVLWLVSLGLAWLVGYGMRDLQEIFGDLNTAGVIEWQAALMGLFEELSGTACVTADQLRAAVEARGWEIGASDPGIVLSEAPFDRAVEVVWVDVTPGLPFSKWDREPFGFGADGCYLS
ncbi:hypothetical protein C8N43_1730 [Litoreibacter ponti]|uniref:Uncharacterized protein n=1 Tax=Litoreibacter ponti TaxID=1510457 RepID=A0A2T6BLY2_9RHOB|nr:hypothetical protein [Litoreibacter ponti]PTX57065.1 hypothetical protein C8N43_1730 [Litoreibacter ponti]